MSSEVVENNLSRYRTDADPQRDSRFCLAQVVTLDSDFMNQGDKISDLVDNRITSESTRSVNRACNMGNCTLRVYEDTAEGRTFTGECMAESYCLKQRFEAVGKTETSDDGRKLYHEICDNLEFVVGKESAGNFCPRLDCGLSAGLSIDMIPGTAGECVLENRIEQPTLPIEPYSD